MPTDDSIRSVYQAYIAYYNRPADPEGLIWWANTLDASAGNLSGIIEKFANSAESQTLYQGVDDVSFIDSIYRAILGRAVEPEGLNFYRTSLQTGERTRATLALDILNGAVSGNDRAVIENKTTYAKLFINAINTSTKQDSYRGDAAAALARLHMNQIDGATSTELLNDRAELAVDDLLELAHQPSTHEQLVLERLNAERSAPAAFAETYGIDLNEGLPAGTISDDPKPPLAFDPLLTQAARQHNEWMLDNNIFSHTGEAGSTPGERIENTGHSSTGYGENLAYAGTYPDFPEPDDTALKLEENLFVDAGILGRGHRLNLLEHDWAEVGIAVDTGSFTQADTTYNAVMMTQDFSILSQEHSYLLGTVFKDADNDQTYDASEGIGGVEVMAMSSSSGEAFVTRTMSAGGFQLNIPDGNYDVQFSWQDETYATSIELLGNNIKADWVIA